MPGVRSAACVDPGEAPDDPQDGAMRLVDRPYARPMHCAATPFLGQLSPGRWVDTGSELPGFDNHVYLHERSVYEAARLLGFPERGEYRQACQDRDKALARVAELERQVAEQAQALEAVQVLKNTGFQQTRPPGRPKTKAVA